MFKRFINYLKRRAKIINAFEKSANICRENWHKMKDGDIWHYEIKGRVFWEIEFFGLFFCRLKIGKLSLLYGPFTRQELWELLFLDPEERMAFRRSLSLNSSYLEVPRRIFDFQL
jgi:hypothetical protein